MDPPPPYTPLPDQYSRVVPQPQQSRPPLPPLPPRSPQQLVPAPANTTPARSHPDVRSASQVSLVPARSAVGARTLLMIYIHGFMGDETSFQSFPAHLHNLLSVVVPQGYLVHTKVYPKFETRHNILVATENFSQWLSQFENDTTDIILLGHSMGGLLSADVALLQERTGLRRHRLLGTISFDTPFLGMHPGVISAGLGSIFRPAPKSLAEGAEPLYQNGEGLSQSSTSLNTVNSGVSQIDEFYSKKPQQNFTVTIPKKEGAWDSTFRFIHKYHSNLTQATGQYLMSHLEFGGCLADLIGLRNRYLAIRALEDGIPNPSGGFDRIRFLNYYTSSTGRTKETPKPPPAAEPATQAFNADLDLLNSEPCQDYSSDTVYAKGLQGLQGLRLGETNLNEHRRNASASSYNTASSFGEMQHITPDPMTDDDEYHGPIALHIVETDDIPIADGRPPAGLLTNEKVPFDDTDECGGPSDITRQTTTESEKISVLSEELQMPPLPPHPEEPSTFDYSQIPDPIVRKVAEKEAAKVWKRYEKAVKDYAKLVRDREKMLGRLEKRKGREVVREVRCKEREERERQKEDRDKEKERGKEERDREKERGKEGRYNRGRERRKEERCKFRELEKEKRKAGKGKGKELNDWEKEKDRQARDSDIKAREELKELEGWEREKELLERDNEIEAGEKLKELKEWEREKERQWGEGERRKGGKGRQESSHEKQELERLRKEQERMDAEYRRMNSIPEPPPTSLSRKHTPPSTTPSSPSSHSHLPISQSNCALPVASSPKSPPQPKQKKREHRFCILPSDKNDKCWAKVEMEGVDEVGAHCGLFFVGEVYERLVGDVAARIEEWVSEESSRKVAELESRKGWDADEKGSMRR